MVLLVRAEIHGLSGRALELRDVLTEHVETTSRETGNLGVSAHQPLGADLGEFLLESWWRDDRALQAHYAGTGYERYVALAGELLARPSDVKIHHIDRSVHPVGDPSLDPTRQG
jgi:quinol monooxygenase YgiN